MKSTSRWLCRGLPAALLFSLVLQAPAAPAAASEPVQAGQLWLLSEYRVPGCAPMPSVPTVFNWLLRKALAIEAFLAASADCGQVGRRDTLEGWTYVFWTEREGTAVEKLVRKAQERYAVTELLSRKKGETFSVRARGYEAFVMIQLGGEQGPARLWAAGDVAELNVEMSVAAPDEFKLRVESRPFEGDPCMGTWALRADAPLGPRKKIACQGG